MEFNMTTITLGTLMTSAAADVINHNGRKIGRFKPRDFDRKTCLDQLGILHHNNSYHSFSSTERVSANVLLNTRYNRLKIGMDDVGSIVEPTSSLALSRRHPCRFSNRYISLSTQR